MTSAKGGHHEMGFPVGCKWFLGRNGYFSDSVDVHICRKQVSVM